MALAREHGLASVAFPSVSTGVYGYPVHLAAPLALQTVAAQSRPPISLVRFVLFDDATFSAYTDALCELETVVG
jgi:O-acetyl-ADP-ribose deacetylase (regulator of RNase III)